MKLVSPEIYFLAKLQYSRNQRKQTVLKKSEICPAEAETGQTRRKTRWTRVMKKYDYVLVGSGLYAGVWAYEAKKRGKTCLVV